MGRISDLDQELFLKLNFPKALKASILSFKEFEEPIFLFSDGIYLYLREKPTLTLYQPVFLKRKKIFLKIEQQRSSQLKKIKYVFFSLNPNLYSGDWIKAFLSQFSVDDADDELVLIDLDDGSAVTESIFFEKKKSLTRLASELHKAFSQSSYVYWKWSDFRSRFVLDERFAFISLLNPIVINYSAVHDYFIFHGCFWQRGKNETSELKILESWNLWPSAQLNKAIYFSDIIFQPEELDNLKNSCLNLYEYIHLLTECSSSRGLFEKTQIYK